MNHNVITKDLETCPAQDPAVLEEFRAQIAANFVAPSTLTKEQAAVELGITDKDYIKFTSKASMIAEWSERFKVEASEASAQEMLRKTSFDGGLGHICVIGYAFADEAPKSIFSHAWLEDEAKILREFYARVDEHIAKQPNVRPTLVGHNIIGFDLRFMFQRSVMLGVKPSHHINFTASAWDDSVYDTMLRWAGRTGTVKQDKLARLLGGEGKKGIDGSMVWDYVKSGRIEEVADYCKDDVSDARHMFKRMTFAQAEVIEEIPF